MSEILEIIKRKWLRLMFKIVLIILRKYFSNDVKDYQLYSGIKWSRDLEKELFTKKKLTLNKKKNSIICQFCGSLLLSCHNCHKKFKKGDGHSCDDNGSLSLHHCYECAKNI